MKKLVYFSAIALTVIMIGCKKESAISIEGFWSGTGTTTGSPPNVFALLFRSNGTALAYLGNTDTTLAFKVNGSYVIGSDSVRTTLSNVSNTSVFSGKLNSAATTMNGTFRSLTLPIDEGTFSLIKN